MVPANRVPPALNLSITGALRDAWRAHPVRMGLLGSTLILLGSLSPAYLPQASVVWEFLDAVRFTGPVAKWVGTICTMAGLFLLIESWLRLRPARRESQGQAPLRHWAILLVMGFPLMLGPPIFSHDAYSYAAQGWLLVNGLNPYEVGPGVLPGYFADQVSWEWRHTPAPYGPLALRMGQFLVELGGLNPMISTFLMRLPALLGVGLIGWSVPRIARYIGISPAAASWFAVLNPILIIDFIGGMHNDSLMVGLMVFGIWVTMHCAPMSGTPETPSQSTGLLASATVDAPQASLWQRSWPWMLGAVFVGLGASIKQPAFLAAVALPFLVEPVSSWHVRKILVGAAKSVLSLLIAVAVFAVISVATGLGFGWLNAVHVPAMVLTFSPSTILGYVVQAPLSLLGWDPSGRAAIVFMRSVGWGVFIVGTCYLALRYLWKRPLTFVSWSFLLFALAAPALHSWYVMWGFVLFPMSRPTQKWLRFAIVLTLVLLGYAAMNFSIRNGPWLVALVLIAGALWSLHSHELTQPWSETDEGELAHPVEA